MEPGGKYTYAPRDPQLQGAIDQLDVVYQQAPYTVISLIFSKPISNIRTFADAFRFKKDEP